jgi:protein-S-isoprenylcysteine O-methyltransferase Ste14
MFLRALVAFLVLPGVFAGLIPALIVANDPYRASGSAWGYPLVATGLFLVLWCVRDFYVAGKGTLAPWDPPRRLVTVGLYRVVRNPMYVSLLILLVGWSLSAGSWLLAGYTALMGLAFHLRVVLYEEPRLARQFGDEWTNYAAKISRWPLFK